MEEFGQFYERDEVEIVSGIPSGIIRKGLLFFLLTIVALLLLSCLIKVKKSISIETKVVADLPVDVKVVPFGSSQNSDLSKDDNANQSAVIKNSALPHYFNDKIVMVRRDFKAMRDTVFTISDKTGIKLFFSINDSDKENRFTKGQNVTVNYEQLNYVFKSKISNIYNTIDNGLIYELDVAELPQQEKYTLICYKDIISHGKINNTESTVFEQIYSNLFNKMKI